MKPDLLHLPFDLHAETMPGEMDEADPATIDADADGDDFDHDADTDIADILEAYDGINGDDDDHLPPNSGACGLPCTFADVTHRKARPKFSLCAVVIRSDPDYPATTDEPDYISDGQELCQSFTRSTAKTLCDGYALTPELMVREFELGVENPTHVVVNDWSGKEVYRRPVIAAA